MLTEDWDCFLKFLFRKFRTFLFQKEGDHVLDLDQIIEPNRVKQWFSAMVDEVEKNVKKEKFKDSAAFDLFRECFFQASGTRKPSSEPKTLKEFPEFFREGLERGWGMHPMEFTRPHQFRDEFFQDIFNLRPRNIIGRGDRERKRCEILLQMPTFCFSYLRNGHTEWLSYV